MHSDPISDMWTRINNASKVKHESTTIPYSKEKENILKMLEKKALIDKVEKLEDGKFPKLKIVFNQKRPMLNIKIISKPGRRMYIKSSEIKKVRSGIGMAVISTSRGIMTDSEAKKAKLGGEIFCEIY